MGALQNTGFGSGPIRRSKGGPGFKAAFAPGTERNLFVSAALGAVGQQLTPGPLADFAFNSAQGGLESFARKRERETQLAQQRALGLLPPEAQSFQGQPPGAFVGGGVSPGFIPGQTPIPGLEPPGQVPGAIGGGGITPEFNSRFGLTSVSGAAGASLPATGPLSSFAQAQTGRRFAGAGRNFPSGGNAGVTLGLSPEIVARTAEGVSREIGTSVRAQTARERTRTIQAEGAAGRKAKVEEREDTQEFLAGESALDREAKLADIQRKDEALVRKEGREDDRALEVIAGDFRKRIDTALVIDESRSPGATAATLQGIRTEILGNLRLLESKPGLLPAVEAQLTRLQSPFDIKLVTMVGPDGTPVAVRIDQVPLKQEQGFQLVGLAASGALPDESADGGPILNPDVAVALPREISRIQAKPIRPGDVPAPTSIKKTAFKVIGRPIKATGDFRKALASFKKGDTVSASFLRKAREFATAINLTGDNALAQIFEEAKLKGDVPEFVIVDELGNIIVDTIGGMTINELIALDQELLPQGKTIAGVKRSKSGLAKLNQPLVILGSF